MRRSTLLLLVVAIVIGCIILSGKCRGGKDNFASDSRPLTCGPFLQVRCDMDPNSLTGFVSTQMAPSTEMIDSTPVGTTRCGVPQDHRGEDAFMYECLPKGWTKIGPCSLAC
jgi:hypothetical protein